MLLVESVERPRAMGGRLLKRERPGSVAAVVYCLAGVDEGSGRKVLPAST